MTQINPNPFAKDNDRTFKLRLYDIKYSDKKKKITQPLLDHFKDLNTLVSWERKRYMKTIYFCVLESRQALPGGLSFSNPSFIQY